MSGDNGQHIPECLPLGWAACNLADAVVPGRARGNPGDFAGQPFVGLEHVEAQTTRLLGYVPAESMRSSGVQFEEGDVLYGRMRPYLNKVWLADRSGLCSGEFIVFPKTGSLRGAFLKYRLNAQDFVTFSDHATTGDRPRADFADFGKFPVLVPPLAEQSRIADRIDELFTDLAAGGAALERVRRNLSRYRAAVLHAAVTGRLTEAWRKQHGKPEEPGPKLLERILDERRRQWERRTLERYQKAGKQPPKNWRDRYREPEPAKAPADGSPLPELPEAWCWAYNAHLVSTITSGSRDWSPYYDRGTGTFIMAGNVRMGRLDLSRRQAVDPPPDHRDRLRSQVEANDLLVTIVGANTGDVCRVAEPLPEHYVCQSVSLMRPVLGDTSTWMLTWFTAPTGAQRQFREFIYGAGRPHLGFEHLEQTLVALPPLAEQAAIVEAVNEKLSQIDALEAQVEHGLARASRLRQAILKAAFEGKLVPQDPSDEPASSLLERIRTETDGAPNGHLNGQARRRGRPRARPTDDGSPRAGAQTTRRKVAR